MFSVFSNHMKGKVNMCILIYDLSIKILCSNSNIANIYLDHLWSHSHTLNICCISPCANFLSPPHYPYDTCITTSTPIIPLTHVFTCCWGTMPSCRTKASCSSDRVMAGTADLPGSLPVYITWVIVTWDNYTQLSSLTGVLRCHCLPILQMSTPSGKWWPQLCQNHLLMLNEDI